MIHVRLPDHLCKLGGMSRELALSVEGTASLGAVIDVLESSYPAIRGALRDPGTKMRRPFIRFFANEEDLSNDPLDAALPENVANGSELLIVVGAIAGG